MRNIRTDKNTQRQKHSSNLADVLIFFRFPQTDKLLICASCEKVTIFHECEPEFLHDLVLKMRAYIFTPGDLICRKGEVAREMFIIADGLLEVIRYVSSLFCTSVRLAE